VAAPAPPAPARAQGLRVAVAGAAGALGREVIGVLAERRFPVAELLPFGSERSLGRDVEFGDEVLAVEAQAPPLRGLDLLILCTPRSPALDLVREALRAEVACIDCSGALVRTQQVAIALADRTPAEKIVAAPLLVAPAGPALAWARALAAFDDVVGLERARGTVLQSAAMAGEAGIEALSQETIALLAQRETPPRSVFPTEVAFDCVPTPGVPDIEQEIAVVLGSVLGRVLPLSAQVVQAPTFTGEGSALALEVARDLEAEPLLAALGKAPGVRRWESQTDRLPGPSTRDAAGSDDVLLGTVRRDAASERGWLAWIAADPIRLAAVNAVKLAETRLCLH